MPKNDHELMLDLIDKLLSAVVDLLYCHSRDNDFPEYFIRSMARHKMAECLHSLREQESPERRAAVEQEINRLRASCALEPTTWEKVVGSAFE